MLVAAAVGTFTLMRLWVLSLAPEMAIWRAVGAPRRRVAGVVLGRTLVAGFTGALLGLWLGPACWEAVAALVARARTWQPKVLLPLALLLMGTALLGGAAALLSLLRRPPALLFRVHEDGRFLPEIEGIRPPAGSSCACGLVTQSTTTSGST